MKKLLVPTLLLLVCCGSSGTSNGTGGPDGGTGCCVLSIDDYLNWCSITENGAPYVVSESFDAGTVVNLSAAPNQGFVWGYWTGTDGAAGGQDMKMTTTVTMNGNKNVLACCPSASQGCSGGMPPPY